ncbi:hypothetical protein FACS1894154_11240 [Betaproteobacteria bacterium]|nr:hypothetical protein FACS1894154_11240 [Betaproteobacteria bacterium]GHU12710.1 hypothetical protein AGMMS50225_21210 [Betaproteobacteria bacterium]GHU21949.1 hypothetical protein FACS189488_01520 [Betaproteobacteria bacterium]
MRHSLKLHPDAEGDLDALFEEDEDAYAAIVAFIEEAQASQVMLERMTSAEYEDKIHTPGFDIKRWQALWRTVPLWRIRLFGVPGKAASRRIVYTFHPGEGKFYILGVIPRDFDYEPSHPLSKRIIRACEDIGVS